MTALDFARAGLHRVAEGVYQVRGDRPVTGLLFTHSHLDHFGGVFGIIAPDDSTTPIIAPTGFLDAAAATAPGALRSALDQSDPNFAIITP